MFIILVSEDTTIDNIGCIDIQSLPFEIMDDKTSVLIPSTLIMYASNTMIDGMCNTYIL